MDFKEILIAVGVVCLISLIVGVALGIAEKVFHVEVDEKEEKVREVLPGSTAADVATQVVMLLLRLSLRAKHLFHPVR